MGRQCSCGQVSPDSSEPRIPPLLLRVCRLWPATTARTLPGDRLSPNEFARKVLTELRSFARAEEWGRSVRLGTHSLRRGAARAITQDRWPFDQQLRAVPWRSSAHRLYFDMGHDAAREITTLLAEAPKDEAPRVWLAPPSYGYRKYLAPKTPSPGDLEYLVGIRHEYSRASQDTSPGRFCHDPGPGGISHPEG